MNPEVNKAKIAMMEAVKAYRQATNQAAAECNSFRDKYEHYQFCEATAMEVERVLDDIADHAEEADLCNTTCPRFRLGDCPYHWKHGDCPRYTDRLNPAEV